MKRLGANGKNVFTSIPDELLVPTNLRIPSDGKRPEERVGTTIVMFNTSCQLNCKHCFISAPMRDEQFIATTGVGTLDGNYVSRIKTAIHPGTNLVITGGEPRRHRYFYQVLRMLSSGGKQRNVKYFQPKNVEIDTNIIGCNTLKKALTFINRSSKAIPDGVSLHFAGSLDDNHAGGSLDEGQDPGEWPKFKERGRQFHTAAVREHVSHYFRAALTPEQKEGKYLDKIRDYVGLPAEKTQHYGGIDVLDLIENPLSRYVGKDGEILPGLTPAQELDLKKKRIVMAISSAKDLAQNKAVVFITHHGKVFLSDPALGVCIGDLKNSSLQRIIAKHVKSLEGDKLADYVGGLQKQFAELSNQ